MHGHAVGPAVPGATGAQVSAHACPLPPVSQTAPRTPRRSSPNPEMHAPQTGVLLLIIYQLLTRLFKGTVVAELPFEPVPFLRRFTHRGLSGEDYRQVSVVRHLPPLLRAVLYLWV